MTSFFSGVFNKGFFLPAIVVAFLVCFMPTKTLANDANPIASKRIPFSLKLSEADLEYELTDPSAAFIKLHFDFVSLQEDDALIISNSDRSEIYTYKKKDFKKSSRWVLSITGDTVFIHLMNTSGQAVVSADHYMRGISSAQTTQSPSLQINSQEAIVQEPTAQEPTEQETIIQETICGVSTDWEDSMCYESSNVEEFQHAQAIAKLFNGGAGQGSVCTAWRVGPSRDLMITNQHCLEDETFADGAEVWFNFQNDFCGSNRLNNRDSKIVKVEVSEILAFHNSTATDIAVFRIATPEATEAFGYLEIDDSEPSLNEQIYIPQHPNGEPLKLSIFESESVTGVCNVDSLSRNETNLTYQCDTSGGSSGSPVISSETHKVIGLHHYGFSGNCSTTNANEGATFASIKVNAPELYAIIDENIRQTPAPTVIPTPTPVITPITTPTPTVVPTPRPTNTTTPAPTDPPSAVDSSSVNSGNNESSGGSLGIYGLLLFMSILGLRKKQTQILLTRR